MQLTCEQIRVLRRVHIREQETGDAASFSDLYDHPRENPHTYRVLRELEDCFQAVAFEFRENPADPWGNRHQFVALTPRGAALLADTLAAERG